MVAVWCVVVAMLALGRAETRRDTVYDLIAGRPDLSEFFKLVGSDPLTLAIMKEEEGTVFAPNNAAFRKFGGSTSYLLIKYHMANLALPTDQITDSSIVTRLKGNQHIFVTRRKHPSGAEDIFFNNAKIVDSNLKAVSSRNDQEQVLHVIDEVLEPTIPANSNDAKLFNPNAFELLANSNKYSLGGHIVEKYYQKVLQLEKAGVFNTRGFHTYFMPVDEHFTGVQDQIGKAVVDGHVIPDTVLFTRTMGNGSHVTMAFGDMLKVSVRQRHQSYPEPAASNSSYEIESSTLVSDSVHRVGTVLARLVKANIAVKNGVVHLIGRPLMVTELTPFQFLEDRSQDLCKEFFDFLQTNAPEFAQTLRDKTDYTIFVPSNKAFLTVDQERLQEIRQSKEKRDKLLNLHLVPEIVTSADVRDLPKPGLYAVPSNDGRRLLRLSVDGVAGGRGTLTVEGGGTNATVVVADLLARGGTVQIIDKLLGVPYRSMGDRLAVDPIMSGTSTLATQSRFGDKIRRMDHNFTMFVPANTAWEKLEIRLPTTYKSLFSDKTSYQATAILDRHLLIGNAYSMDDLVNRSRTSGPKGVRMYKGSLLVEQDPYSSGYLVKWEGMQARVIRTNVECTNGYIHVIDDVMMRARDVTTSVSSAPTAARWAAGCLAAALAALAAV